jgi:hypothetical protein
VGARGFGRQSSSAARAPTTDFVERAPGAASGAARPDHPAEPAVAVEGHRLAGDWFGRVGGAGSAGRLDGSRVLVRPGTVRKVAAP